MTGNGWVLRRAEHADLAQVLHAVACWPGAPPWTADHWSGFLKGSGEAALWLLVDAAGEPAGCVAGTVVLDTAELEMLLVGPGYRQQGWGRQLLHAWIRWAGRAGAEQVFLEVRASNEAALRLYRRYGFVDEGCRRNYYADPREDAVLMRFKLPDEQPEGRNSDDL